MALTVFADAVGAQSAAEIAEAKRACEAGSRVACLEAGMMLEGRDGAPEAYAAAAPYYERICEAAAADRFSLAACRRLGWLYLMERLPSDDPKRARDAFNALCEVSAEDGGSCAEAALLHALKFRSGEGFRALVEDCGDRARDYWGCRLAASLARERGLIPRAEPEQSPLDVQRLEQSCIAGHGGICVRLTEMAELGADGRAINLATALIFYHIACMNGVIDGCRRAARMDRSGRGPNFSVEGADFYQQVACSFVEDAECMTYRGGFMLRKKPEDARKAFGLFDKACAMGDEVGCIDAVEILQANPDFGGGGGLDGFYERRCAGGVGLMCWERAKAYIGQTSDLQGVPDRSAKKAAAFGGKACAGGNAIACKLTAALDLAHDAVSVDRTAIVKTMDGLCFGEAIGEITYACSLGSDLAGVWPEVSRSRDAYRDRLCAFSYCD